MVAHERRRYFRINDSIAVSCRTLTDADTHQPAILDHQTTIDEVIGNINGRVDYLLKQLCERDPEMGELVELFNRKLNHVADKLISHQHDGVRAAHKVQEVNISACGMAMAADESLAVGTRLTLDLILLPVNVHVYTRAVIVESLPLHTGNNYYWRMEFTDMDSVMQEVLIQHLVQRQSQQLWALRNVNR